MAPVIPDPKKIKAFKTEAAFERWLGSNHARETEVWLKIHKKDSGMPTVTHAQALDVALCWEWIDGLRKSSDEHSFLQRFSPRVRELDRQLPTARQCGVVRRGLFFSDGAQRFG